MKVTLKAVQPGMKKAVNESGDILAYVSKVDGEIAIDHIKTAYDDDALIWPNDNNGRPLKTYKQALEFLLQWFNE